MPTDIWHACGQSSRHVRGGVRGPGAIDAAHRVLWREEAHRWAQHLGRARPPPRSCFPGLRIHWLAACSPNGPPTRPPSSSSCRRRATSDAQPAPTMSAAGSSPPPEAPVPSAGYSTGAAPGIQGPTQTQHEPGDAPRPQTGHIWAEVKTTASAPEPASESLSEPASESPSDPDEPQHHEAAGPRAGRPRPSPSGVWGTTVSIFACLAVPACLVLPHLWPGGRQLLSPGQQQAPSYAASHGSRHGWEAAPSGAAPTYAPAIDLELATHASDVQPLRPDAFPPHLDPGWSQTHFSWSSLYPPGEDPHAGELPPHLLWMLENPPPPFPPPRPDPAGPVPPHVWRTHPWNPQQHGSRSRFEDTAHWESLAAQAAETTADFRTGTSFHGWQPPIAQLTAPHPPLPKVQHTFPSPKKYGGGIVTHSRAARMRWRQNMVRNAFLRAWEGYKAHAWGHDELCPLSNGSTDPFNGWGASIVDALDTLLLMGLPREYAYARQHVRDIDFTLVSGARSAYGQADGRVPVFETAIRYLGGLLSAHDLSGDPLMLIRAEELAQLLLPAFNTYSGVPLGRLKLGQPVPPGPAGTVILAEAGSLVLEFTRLWQVTGNLTYYSVVQRTADWLANNITLPKTAMGVPAKTGSLLPTYLRPESPGSSGAYTFGGMADSYYEYLIKAYQLLGGRIKGYGSTYSAAARDAHKSLFAAIKTVPGTPLLVVGQAHGPQGGLSLTLEHLACFSGGMLGLGARLLPERSKEDLLAAQRVTETCYWSYNATLSGLGPEDVTFFRTTDRDRFNAPTAPSSSSSPGQVTSNDQSDYQAEQPSSPYAPKRGSPRGNPQIGVRRTGKEYKGRPETIESILYMYRITGDWAWQERGWQMFASWVTHAMTPTGFAHVEDVNGWPTHKLDSMESFVFAETFKYYYLLFSPPGHISLDEYVFTTEGHPLLVPHDGNWARPGSGSERFWNPVWADPQLAPGGREKTGTESIRDDSRTQEKPYIGGEGGSVGGLTNVQKHAVLIAHKYENDLALIQRVASELHRIARGIGIGRSHEGKESRTGKGVGVGGGGDDAPQQPLAPSHAGSTFEEPELPMCVDDLASYPHEDLTDMHDDKMYDVYEEEDVCYPEEDPALSDAEEEEINEGVHASPEGGVVIDLSKGGLWGRLRSLVDGPWDESWEAEAAWDPEAERALAQRDAQVERALQTYLALRELDPVRAAALVDSDVRKEAAAAQAYHETAHEEAEIHSPPKTDSNPKSEGESQDEVERLRRLLHPPLPPKPEMAFGSGGGRFMHRPR